MPPRTVDYAVVQSSPKLVQTMSLRCASALVSYVTEQEAVNVSSDSTHKTNCSENMVRFGDVLTIENPSQTCWCVNIFIFLTLWTTKTTNYYLLAIASYAY